MGRRQRHPALVVAYGVEKLSVILVWGQYSEEQVRFERGERVLEEGFQYQVFPVEIEKSSYRREGVNHGT